MWGLVDANPLSLLDIVTRVGAAGLGGALVGLNRNLHHQGAGMRTFGLVALATGGITVGMLQVGGDPGALSRTVQGVMAGIGFLGGGVILRRSDLGRVTGLTSAAAIWFVAGNAILCALGLWTLTAVLMMFAFFLLLFGRSVEQAMVRLFGVDNVDDEEHEL